MARFKIGIVKQVTERMEIYVWANQITPEVDPNMTEEVEIANERRTEEV